MKCIGNIQTIIVLHIIIYNYTIPMKQICKPFLYERIKFEFRLSIIF